MTIPAAKSRRVGVARHPRTVDLARRMLGLIERRTTDRAEASCEFPAGRYLDPDRFRREEEILFRRTPVFAGLSVELAAGRYMTLDLPGAPLLLTRDAAGDLSAFVNACRHRGARLADGCGLSRGFTCPYHGWCYGADGRLEQVPGGAGFDDVDLATRGLARVPVAEAHGLMFVQGTPAEDATPRLDVTGLVGAPMAAELRDWSLDEVALLGCRSFRSAANWKLTLDTHLETYHFPTVHAASVASVTYADHTTFDACGRHCVLGFTGKSIGALAGVAEEEWEPLEHLEVAYTLFPNTVLKVAADHVEYFRVLPDGPAHSTTTHAYFTLAHDQLGVERHERRFARSFATLTDEDGPLAENVQRSLAAGGLTSVLFGRHEPALQHQHRMYDEALGGLSGEPTTPVDVRDTIHVPSPSSSAPLD